MASPCSSAVPRPWSPSGWRELVTTILSFTVSTWRGYGALSTRTWLHSMPEKQTTASLRLYKWPRVCMCVWDRGMFVKYGWQLDLNKGHMSHLWVFEAAHLYVTFQIMPCFEAEKGFKYIIYMNLYGGVWWDATNKNRDEAHAVWVY